MKTKRLLKLAEALRNDSTETIFMFGDVFSQRHPGCGCALAIADEIFKWGLAKTRTSPTAFSKAQEYFGISALAADVLFCDGNYRLKTKHGSLRSIKTREELVSAEDMASRIEYFVQIKRKA